MKTLFLVRHAKAVARGPAINDIKRSLVQQGRADARILAKLMKSKGVRPDALYSSPANRALETAQVFAEALKQPVQSIVLDDAIYDEGAEGLFSLVRKFNDRHNSVMIFGHNPSLTDFAAFLVKGFDKNIPKSGAVCISFKAKHWSKIAEGQGKLGRLVFPSKKDREVEAFKALRKDVQEILSQEIESALAEVYSGATEKMYKLIRKASKKLAESFVRIVRDSRKFKAAGKELGLGKAKPAQEEKPAIVTKRPSRPRQVKGTDSVSKSTRKRKPPEPDGGTSKK
jgi:phosphohistidine phosphatase